MYKEIIFILHCFVLSWCFPDPYVFRLTVCFSADPGWPAGTPQLLGVGLRCISAIFCVVCCYCRYTRSREAREALTDHVTRP